MNAREIVERQGRAKNVVGLEIADPFPQGSEQLRRDLKTGLAGHLAIGEAQQFEFITAEFGGFLLLLQSDFESFFAGAEMMARFAVRADDHTTAKVMPEL